MSEEIEITIKVCQEDFVFPKHDWPPAWKKAHEAYEKEKNKIRPGDWVYKKGTIDVHKAVFRGELSETLSKNLTKLSPEAQEILNKEVATTS